MMNKELNEANAIVAWAYAVNPSHAKQMEETFSGMVESWDIERVKKEFGEKAAFAWITAVQARESFFTEIGK